MEKALAVGFIGLVLLAILGAMWLYLTVRINADRSSLKSRAKRRLEEGDWNGAAAIYKDAILAHIGSPDEVALLLTDLNAIYRANNVVVETSRISEFSKAYKETFTSEDSIENSVVRGKVKEEMRIFLGTLP